MAAMPVTNADARGPGGGCSAAFPPSSLPVPDKTRPGLDPRTRTKPRTKTQNPNLNQNHKPPAVTVCTSIHVPHDCDAASAGAADHPLLLAKSALEAQTQTQ